LTFIKNDKENKRENLVKSEKSSLNSSKSIALFARQWCIAIMRCKLIYRDKYGSLK
jgi:hypothetical protein